MSKASEPLSGLFYRDYIIVCMVFLPLTFSAGVLSDSYRCKEGEHKFEIASRMLQV